MIRIHLRPGPLERRVAELDLGVDRVLDRFRGHRGLDRVMYTASSLGDHSLVWHLVAAGQALRHDRPASAAYRAWALIGIESALVNGPVKALFRRTRPTIVAARPHRLRAPRTSSFPSGHASAAFTFAGMTDPDDPLRPAVYGLAAVVATSRAYVQIHHASDVLGGVVTGVILGRVFRWWWPPDDPWPRLPRRSTMLDNDGDASHHAGDE